jgi:hypothetical protein
MGSQKFSLDRADLIKIGKGALIAAAGAVAAYLTTVAADWRDSPGTTSILAAVFGVAANLIRKWVTDNSKDVAK